MYIKILIYIYLFVIIFLGAVNPFKYEWIISYVDAANILYLIYFLFHGLMMKRKYLYLISKIDILLISLITLLTIPSIIFNETINSAHLYGHFYTIRIFITYKIFSFIYYEYELSYKRTITIEDFFRPFLFLSLISGAISIIKFFPIPIADLLNDIWPVVSNNQIVKQIYWGRLWGTMGGTNTAGNFFTMAACTSLYMYLIKRQSFYKYHFTFFSLCVLLSLSFSSIISYLIIIAYLLYKNINYKTLFLAGLTVMAITGLLNQLEIFNPFIEKRIDSNIGSESIVPKNLQARLG